MSHVSNEYEKGLTKHVSPCQGTYASWFTTQSITSTPTSSPSLLTNAISYVVAALPEPSLCLPAANALRDLCDANRAALAPHIGAFAEVHAGLTGIPVSDVIVPRVSIFSVCVYQDTEKSKVLQSIASVIQALPPEEEIPPVLAIVSPVVEKLEQALRSSSRVCSHDAPFVALFSVLGSSLASRRSACRSHRPTSNTVGSSQRAYPHRRFVAHH